MKSIHLINHPSKQSSGSDLFLAVRLYHPSLSAGLLDYILCLCRAGVDKFLLVGQHLLVRVRDSVTLEFVLAPLAASRVSCSSYLDGFRDGPYSCCVPGMLVAGFVQYHHHHHHHVVPPARISLTLSRHFSLYFIAFSRFSGLHPVSSHSCSMYVRTGRPTFAWP